MAQRLSELTRSERRRIVGRSVSRITLTTVLLFVAYYQLPFDPDTDASTMLLLGVIVVAFGGLVAWAARRIMVAKLPVIRAAEVIAIVVPVYVLIFSMVYGSLSRADAGMFSESLDHNSAIYFTTTVLSTVGFGDITPVTGGARLVVSAQMMLNLVLIGAVIRGLASVARQGFEREEGSGRE